MNVDACGSKSLQISPELELLVVVQSQTRTLGTELGSFVRAAHALTAEPSLHLPLVSKAFPVSAAFTISQFHLSFPLSSYEPSWSLHRRSKMIFTIFTLLSSFPRT